MRARGECRKFDRTPLASGSLGKSLNDSTSSGGVLAVGCNLFSILKENVVDCTRQLLCLKSASFFIKNGQRFPA